MLNYNYQLTAKERWITLNLKQKAFGLVKNVKDHWKTPANGRYMPFKEIASYAGGGIGAYMIITIGSACILGTGNTLITSALGVRYQDMVFMHVIAVLLNIPMTAIRANIIDNTRNKAGKYRPYIVTMAIPSAITSILMVWFPYSSLGSILPAGEIFGDRSYVYVAKCALVMLFNIILHFCYYFFYDGYENLIHVLSPNTQERTDVASIKSVVYSFAPTVVNLISPIIAERIFKTNMTDIRVFKLLYPILAVGGILLCLVVYRNTEEKIVQARTHVVKIRFIDALREVAKNKYFWIISLAGWLGFLESAFLNIMFWLYNYGGACSGDAYGIITTVYGNASLWGMLLAPFCIRKWGKKAVLIATNIFNIIFILLMYPIVQEINGATIWLVLCCLYMNAFMGSFAHILNPAIQADIRDYQQYKSGERIDGMFGAVGTIGTVITLFTALVLPQIYKSRGMTVEEARRVLHDPVILARNLGGGKTVGDVIQEQIASGTTMEELCEAETNALYDPDILMPLLSVLVLVSAVGAAINVIPYFWYDFNEKKQKSVIRVLQVRAMFEDFGNGVLVDSELKTGLKLINDARALSAEKIVPVDKALKKKDKTAYKEALKQNEEIEIAKFVCEELDKYESPYFAGRIAKWKDIYEKGLDGLKNMKKSEIRAEIRLAKKLPKNTKQQKEARSAELEIARNKKYALKVIRKNYAGDKKIEMPDYTLLDSLFNQEYMLEEKLKDLYANLSKAKKDKSANKAEIKKEINKVVAEKKKVHIQSKKESDRLAILSRAAKPFLDAEKNLKQMHNYSKLDELTALFNPLETSTTELY